MRFKKGPVSGLRFPDVVIGFLLAVAIFSFGFTVGHGPDQFSENLASAGLRKADQPPKPQPFTTEWFIGDGTVFFTALLCLIAIIQAALFIGQLIYMRKGLGDAHDAALAARANSQAVIEAERARLFVNIADSRAIVLMQRQFAYDHASSGSMTIGLPPITYCFKNYGKTPALIHELGHGHLIADQLPSERTFSLGVPLPVDFVLGPGDQSAVVSAALDTVAISTIQSIRELESTFWFYGYVVYGDAFGSRYRLDWVWHFSGISNGFRTYSYRETGPPES
jgi:hypothetical protein